MAHILVTSLFIHYFFKFERHDIAEVIKIFDFSPVCKTGMLCFLFARFSNHFPHVLVKIHTITIPFDEFSQAKSVGLQFDRSRSPISFVFRACVSEICLYIDFELSYHINGSNQVVQYTG